MRRLPAAAAVATLMLLIVPSGVLADGVSVAAPAAAAPPNFTLSAGSSDVRVVQGASATVSIAIGRVAGSAGDIGLAVSGLPAGVHAQFAPNPAAPAASTLTLSADPTAPPLSGGDVPVTVTGTPRRQLTR
jgi:hypothetical protein